MATQCKLQRKLTPQLIKPNTWTLLVFDTILRNDRSMQKGMSLIIPPVDGDFIWGRNISWGPFDIPKGDLRVRQTASRFIRDPHGEDDDTGSDDKLDTPGRDFTTGTWVFKGDGGKPIGVEVWHDHTGPVFVTQSQFSATTWDY